MKTELPKNWYDQNRQYLMSAVESVREMLEAQAGQSKSGFRKGASRFKSRTSTDDFATEMETPPALETLCSIFGLSSFERNILLLCAGLELDAKLAALRGSVQGDAAKTFATFGLALAVFPDSHWSALAPTSPLRFWRLIEISAGASLTAGPLRVDERILNYLTGVHHPDGRLLEYLEGVERPEALVPSHQRLADEIRAALANSVEQNAASIIQLNGVESAGKRTIAAAACTSLGFHLNALSAHFIPTSQSELFALAQLLTREVFLGSNAILLDCENVDGADAIRVRAINKLVKAVKGVVFLASRDPWQLENRVSLAFEVKKPTIQEQQALWQAGLGLDAHAMNGEMQRLTSQFDLNLQAISSVSAEIKAKTALRSGAQNDAGFGRLLWDVCRVQSRPKLDDLAQLIEPMSGWDDLVLPRQEKHILRDIAAHLRQRIKVYEEWGFASKTKRGLGISALFAGASGTGKTMAAEVLANEFRLDLYRIDLSAVVNKYIGETEKNLRRIFDAAEGSGVILLFDEADALFGKRSDVKDSHDRYANIEVSYLLQRMEAYRGLAILTTNRRGALDSAFLRRLRFIINFPFPDTTQRLDIWNRIFPAATPINGLDYAKLARLNIAGGSIQNIAMNAAFLAADKNEPVRMQHLLRAARSEYAKIEKALSEAEIRGWE